MKFHILCKNCEYEFGNFKDFFNSKCKCPNCCNSYIDIVYKKTRCIKGYMIRGIWGYFDFLPLTNWSNVITAREGDVLCQEWEFLEDYAKTLGLNISVFAHRHDNNPATGTFKDLSGSLLASVLQENGIKQYAVASTGNIGVAYARYLAEAGITLYAFLPKDSSLQHQSEILCFGQRVFKCSGNYDETKLMMVDFADANNIPYSLSYDPIRIEAKKTIAFDWLDQLEWEFFPTVYIQAISSGIGPLGIMKGCETLLEVRAIEKKPRMILVQPDTCCPMVSAWEKAKRENFLPDWYNNYQRIEPKTKITTLSTGNPKLYPTLAKEVLLSDGDFISFPETYAKDVGTLVAYEKQVRMGPAAAVAVGGFFKALHKGLIKDGDNVMLMIGEGVRRSPDFLNDIASLYPTIYVDSANECVTYKRDYAHNLVWNFVNYL